MGAKPIDLDAVTWHLFRPKDDDAFFEYFSDDGPERPLSFFFANHAEQIGSEDANYLPEPGDSVMVGEEEMIVRHRLFLAPKEAGAARQVALLLTAPFGLAEASANAS